MKFIDTIIMRYAQISEVKYTSAKPGALRLLAPRRGLFAIDYVKIKTRDGNIKHTPGTVELWESPTRGGGLPIGNYIV